VPHLRIIDDALWKAVKARQEEVRIEIGRDEGGNALNCAHRRLPAQRSIGLWRLRRRLHNCRC